MQKVNKTDHRLHNPTTLLNLEQEVESNLSLKVNRGSRGLLDGDLWPFSVI